MHFDASLAPEDDAREESKRVERDNKKSVVNCW
jgi:hypothetical protein